MLYKTISLNEVESDQCVCVMSGYLFVICQWHQALQRPVRILPDHLIKPAAAVSIKSLPTWSCSSFLQETIIIHTNWNCVQHWAELNVCLYQNCSHLQVNRDNGHLHNWSQYGPDQTAATHHTHTTPTTHNTHTQHNNTTQQTHHTTPQHNNTQTTPHHNTPHNNTHNTTGAQTHPSYLYW